VRTTLLERNTAVAKGPTTRELETRLDGMSEAIRLVQSRVDRMPTPDMVQSDVEKLREVTGTRIDALSTLLDSKLLGNEIALKAALLTRKEATEEIKENFGKQFENQAKLIEALKERIDRTEGRAGGLDKGWGIFVSAVGIIGIIATIIVTRT